MNMAANADIAAAQPKIIMLFICFWLTISRCAMHSLHRHMLPMARYIQNPVPGLSVDRPGTVHPCSRFYNVMLIACPGWTRRQACGIPKAAAHRHNERELSIGWESSPFHIDKPQHILYSTAQFHVVPSSSGSGRRPLTPVTRVRIPLGSPSKTTGWAYNAQPFCFRK